VLEGAVGIEVPSKLGGTEETMVEVMQLGPGECFGELALIKTQRRAASVICKENSKFATLNKETFSATISAGQTEKLQHKLELIAK
jgi:CRP-like cAMP-binding protein